MPIENRVEPSCAYCRFGTDMGRDRIVCIKHGIMYGGGSCGLFRYEPTKRVPPVLRGLDSTGFSDEDFTL